MTDDIKADPAMPSITLRLSEWQYGRNCSRMRLWMTGGVAQTDAAMVWPEKVRVYSPTAREAIVPCDGVEDGMCIADAVLRRWIEEAGE